MTNSTSSYWERPHRLSTGSGTVTEPFYESVDTDHLSPPGTYPYVRGLHRDGYRGRLWTRREIAGFGGPEDTNARFHYLLGAGRATGLNCHFDLPTHLTLDPDHPASDGEIGGAGPSVCMLDDMEVLTAGLDLGSVSMSLISSTTANIVLMPMYALIAERRGIPLDSLRGTIQNDPLHARYCGYEASCPIDLSLKTSVDLMEWCSKDLPNWHTNNINMYDLREHGISAAQELAFGFGLARTYIDLRARATPRHARRSRVTCRSIARCTATSSKRWRSCEPPG